eukprot:3415127-Rhodomonas_salina.1
MSSMPMPGLELVPTEKDSIPLSVSSKPCQCSEMATCPNELTVATTVISALSELGGVKSMVPAKCDHAIVFPAHDRVRKVTKTGWPCSLLSRESSKFHSISSAVLSAEKFELKSGIRSCSTRLPSEVPAPKSTDCRTDSRSDLDSTILPCSVKPAGSVRRVPLSTVT